MSKLNFLKLFLIVLFFFLLQNTYGQNLNVVGQARINGLSGIGLRMVIVDADGNLSTQAISINTDAQTLSLLGNMMSLSAGTGGGGNIDLSTYLDNTDAQTLTLNANNLELAGGTGGGGVVDLSGYLDDTDDQTLSFNNGNNELTIADGNTVDLSALSGVNTDEQTLTLNANSLELAGGTGGGGVVDLSGYLDDTDTDDQTLSFNNGTNELTIADGNTVDLSALSGVNTDEQTLTLNANSLELAGGTGGGGVVDLSGYLDDTDTDDQTLSFNNGTNELTIADGNTVDLSALAGGSSHWTINGTEISNTNVGAVGIGTSTIPSGYQLAVEGNIICEEVLIELSTNWPDYVFADDYTLRSIPDVKKYIAAHKHLPGIPSAAEIEKQGGAEVGDVQRRMLEKMEEMMLYIIELHEEIEALKEK